MGNRHTLNPQIPIINIQQWKETSVNSSDQAIYGDFRTLSKITQQEQYDGNNSEVIDQYELFFSDEDDYKLYLQAFIWRLKQPNIVRTKYLKEQHSQQFCSKTYSAKIYIENIKTRLSDITDIPFPENLYVAFCAFEGYHKLYDHLHYFKVEESQICVDAQGEVRVWLNSDLSKNYPNVQQEQLNSDQTHMVQQILTILDQNTDKDSEPASLIEFYEKFYERNNYKNNGRIGFEDAKLILEQYVRQHNVQVPTYFESIMQIYRNEQVEDGQQKFENKQIRENDMDIDISRQNRKLQQSRTSQQGYSRSIHMNGVNQANSYPLNSIHQHYHPANSYTNSGAVHGYPQNRELRRVPQVVYQNGRMQYNDHIWPLNINSINKSGSLDSKRNGQTHVSPSFAPSHRQRQNYQSSVNSQIQPHHLFHQMFNGKSTFNQPNYYHTSQHLFTIPFPQRHNISLQTRHPMHVNSVLKPMSALPQNHYRPYTPNQAPVHSNYHMPIVQDRRNLVILQNQGQKFGQQRVQANGQRILLTNQIKQKVYHNSLTNLQNQEVNQQEREGGQQNIQTFNSSHNKANNMAREGKYSTIRENPAQLLNSSSPSVKNNQGYMDVSSGRKIVSAVSPTQSQLNSHAKAQTQVVSSNSFHSNSFATQQNNKIQRVNSNEMKVFHGSNVVKKNSLAEYQQQLYNENGLKIGSSSFLRNSVPSGASGSGSQNNYSRHAVRQKTQYYTLETTQSLDPQIAQDLKKFYSFE